MLLFDNVKKSGTCLGFFCLNRHKNFKSMLSGVMKKYHKSLYGEVVVGCVKKTKTQTNKHTISSYLSKKHSLPPLPQLFSLSYVR